MNKQCRICGSHSTSIFFERANTFFWYGVENASLNDSLGLGLFDAVLYYCEYCGAVLSPDDPALKEILRTVYCSKSSVPGATPGNTSEYARRLAEDFYKTFTGIIGHKVPSRVIEIGCQRGYLLHYFKTLGAKRVIGVEPGDVEPWTDNDGLTVDVRKGFFNKELIGEDGFDFIYSLQVLEHVEHPNEFLSEIHALLKAGGRVMFSVPNEMYSMHYGNAGMFIFQHLNYFTPATLRFLLEKNGFDIISVISERSRELIVLAEKQATLNKKTPRPEDAAAQTGMLAEAYGSMVDEKLLFVSKLVSKFRPKPLGLYGVAGMSNFFSWITGLADKDIEIFDSDSALWGKRCGGVPFEVRPPSELKMAAEVLPVPFRLQKDIALFLKELPLGLDVHLLYPESMVLSKGSR